MTLADVAPFKLKDYSSAIATLIVAAVGFIIYSARIEGIVTASDNKLEGKIAVMQSQIIAMQTQSAEYRPRVDALLASDKLINERFQNTSVALNQLRQNNSDDRAVTNKILSDLVLRASDISERLVRIETTLARDGVPGPRVPYIPPSGNNNLNR